MHSVCVFCGSSSGVRAECAAAARSLGAELARRGIRLVYGGASVGLMGELADAALAAGGRVVGVLPRHLEAKELAHGGLSELHVVESMHERKARMSDLADAFVVLPGGYGTLDETFEALTWSQLGLQDKPVAFLDVAGYFRPLAGFLDHCHREGFLRAEHRDLVIMASDPPVLLDALGTWSPARVDKWLTSGER